MKLALIAALAALGLGAVAFAGIARPDGAHGTPAPATATADPQEITVTAVGSVKHVPDTSSLQFAVVSDAADAQEALADNNRAVNKLIDALKDAGVDSKDIQTASVSLQPHYPENSNHIDGYSASNSVSVTSKIEKAGKLIDVGVGAGANSVAGPSLSIADQDALYRDALKDAVQSGRLKAEAIADAAGVTVGRVTNVVEGSPDTYQPEPMASFGAAQKDAATPIEAGTQEIQATVTVTFAIA